MALPKPVAGLATWGPGHGGFLAPVQGQPLFEGPWTPWSAPAEATGGWIMDRVATLIDRLWPNERWTWSPKPGRSV